MSKLRPTLQSAAPGTYAPQGGTAYLMVLKAVEPASGLVHGHLHAHGEHCAIGNFFEVNKKAALGWSVIDEIAAVNDSVPHYTERKRKLFVMRWLKWKLAQCGMPGYSRAVAPAQK